MDGAQAGSPAPPATAADGGTDGTHGRVGVGTGVASRRHAERSLSDADRGGAGAHTSACDVGNDNDVAGSVPAATTTGAAEDSRFFARCALCFGLATLLAFALVPTLVLPHLRGGPYLDESDCGSPLVPLQPVDAPPSTCSTAGRRIAGFFHVGVGAVSPAHWWEKLIYPTQYRWPLVADELAQQIASSKLGSCAEAVHVGVVGDLESWDADHPAIFDDNPLFHVDYRDASPHNYEFPTLKMLHDYCLAQPDALVFYIHTKGAHNARGDAQAWRQLMAHYIVTHADACIEQMEAKGKTACGMRWLDDYYPIMVGNFWWASCAYVKHLRCPLPPPNQAGMYGHGLPLNPTGRYLAELWIGTARGISHPTDCAPLHIVNCTRCGWGIEFPDAELVPQQPVLCGRDANDMIEDIAHWIR